MSGTVVCLGPACHVGCPLDWHQDAVGPLQAANGDAMDMRNMRSLVASLPQYRSDLTLASEPSIRCSSAVA